MSEPAAGCLVKVVGPCKSGKSSLVDGLKSAGYRARSCAQEHSDVPHMWRHIAPPDVLVYLDASLDTIRSRDDRSDWTSQRLELQHRRLAHACQHADLVVDTDGKTTDEVLETVLAYLRERFPGQVLRNSGNLDPSVV